MEQLKERKLQDQAEINMLYRSRINLQKMLPFSNEVEKESALGQISRIEDEIRKMRRNLQNEKGILKRMGEIEHKEKIVKEISAGQSMGQRKGPKSEERQRAGKGGRIYG